MSRILQIVAVSILLFPQLGTQISNNFLTDIVHLKTASEGKYYVVDFVLENDDQLDSVAVASGTLISEPTEPTRAGFIFIGWYTEKNGGKKWEFSTDVMPTKKIQLHARFKEIDGTILLTAKRTQATVKTTKDTSAFDVVELFGITAIDSDNGDLIAKGLYTVAGLDSLDVTTVGLYTLTFIATNSVGKTATQELIVDVQESLVSGSVFDDTTNTNSKKDDNSYISGVTVKLIDVENNLTVAQTKTTEDGSYILGIPSGVIEFIIQVTEPKGYVQAPKMNDSVFNEQGKSDVLTVQGQDIIQQDIGFAKATRVTINPNSINFQQQEQKKIDITVTNGALFEVTITDPALFSVEQTAGGLIFTNIATGKTSAVLTYKDGYGRLTQPESIITLQSS